MRISYNVRGLKLRIEGKLTNPDLDINGDIDAEYALEQSEGTIEMQPAGFTRLIRALTSGGNAKLENDEASPDW